MGLLSKIFSSSPRDLHPPQAETAPETARNVESFPLPPGQYDNDVHRWHAQTEDAQRLLAELNQLESLQEVKKGEKFIQSGPPLPLRPSTLLDASRRGSSHVLSERLHANQLGGDTVLMATPKQSQSKLWRHSMQEHHITHVVDVGSDLETALQDLIPRVLLPHPRGPSLAGASPACRHWSVTLNPKHSVPPSMMLKVFRELAEDPPQPGCQVAFCSPGGDHRSAVFAAGWKVYQDVTRLCQQGKRVSQGVVANLVQEAVLKIKTNRSTHLLSQAVHVSALLALGLEVRDTFQRGGASHPAAIRTPHDQKATALTPETRRAAADPAHARAAREICDKIKQTPSSTVRDFAPIKGSTGQPRRIRIEQMYPADPQLKGLSDARLLGAWASPGTLILEPTQPAQALALAVACLKHNVAAVIDVAGSAGPAIGHAMDNGTRTFEQNSSATFDWDSSGEVSLGDPLNATAIGMQASAQVRGEAVLRNISREPIGIRKQHLSPTIHPVKRVRAPLTAGKAVPPQELLAIGRLIERFRSEGAGTPVVVQCPAGDWRGAMAAAAGLLFHRFQEGQLDQRNRHEAVKDVWTQLCSGYSMDLADEPEQLASLLGMADLLVAQPSRWH